MSWRSDDQQHIILMISDILLMHDGMLQHNIWSLDMMHVIICERPRKNPASCIIAYCSGSGINEIANEIVRLCGIVRGAVNRRSGSDRSLRELSFDT